MDKPGHSVSFHEIGRKQIPSNRYLSLAAEKRIHVKRSERERTIESKAKKNGICIFDRVYIGPVIRLFRVASSDKCSHLEAKCLNGNFNLIVCHCWSFVFTVSHFRLRFISNVLLHLLRSKIGGFIWISFDSFEWNRNWILKEILILRKTMILANSIELLPLEIWLHEIKILFFNTYVFDPFHLRGIE